MIMRNSLKLLAGCVAMFVGRASTTVTAAEDRYIRVDADYFAQTLVAHVISVYPEIITFSIHAIPRGAKERAVIASSFGKIGRVDAGDTLKVFETNEPKIWDLRETAREGKLECVVPLWAKSGEPIGVLGFAFKYKAGDDSAEFLRKAIRIRDELREKIVDVDDLFKPER